MSKLNPGEVGPLSSSSPGLTKTNLNYEEIRQDTIVDEVLNIAEDSCSARDCILWLAVVRLKRRISVDGWSQPRKD